MSGATPVVILGGFGQRKVGGYIYHRQAPYEGVGDRWDINASNSQRRRVVRHVAGAIAWRGWAARTACGLIVAYAVWAERVDANTRQRIATVDGSYELHEPGQYVRLDVAEVLGRRCLHCWGDD